MGDDDGPPTGHTAAARGPTGNGDETDSDHSAETSHGRERRDEKSKTGVRGGGEGDEADTETAVEAVREELMTDEQSIDERIRWKWTLNAVAVAAVVGVTVSAISVFGLGWGVLPGVGAFGLLAILGIGHVVLLYRSWRYEIRADALYLERGVFTHVKTVVPFVRVQHIDTSRSPIDRAIGLSSLVVYTAGSRGADVTIPGLRPARATDLQDRLKVLAKDSTGDDAV
ncbi:MAG: PH domain-containing protein [Halorhabdus sp.]